MRTLPFAATLVAASLLTAANACALDLPVEGGFGGGPFRVACNNGFVVGFEGRTGAYIDQMRLVCGTWNAATRRVTRTGPYPVTIGTSNGGGPASALCPDGWAVAEINFENTWRDEDSNFTGFVHHISFRCLAPATGEMQWITFGPTTPIPRPEIGSYLNLVQGQPCPNGQLLTGLYGRAGLFVDALGSICGPTPAAAPPPPTPVPQVAGVDPNKATLPTTSRSVDAIRGATGNTNTAAAGKIAVPNPSGVPLSTPIAPPQPGAPAQPALQPATPPAPTGPSGFAFACQGGPGMAASLTGDVVTIIFAPANVGFAAMPPGPGQCAFSDRALRANEPKVLTHRGPEANALYNQVNGGGAFQVHVNNNNQGAMVVSSVDVIPRIPNGSATTQLPAVPATGGAPAGGVATATTAVNVRTGPGSSFPAIGILGAGTSANVLQCDPSWCQLAQSAGAPSGWVAKQFLLLAGQPSAPQAPPANPAAAAIPGFPPQSAAVTAASFTGTWATSTDKGYSYAMQLNQVGTTVTGTYVVNANGSRGRLNGVVTNGVLNFSWDQDGGFTGTGQFTLGGDGRSFAGTYRADPNPALTPNLLTGTWRGQKT